MISSITQAFGSHPILSTVVAISKDPGLIMANSQLAVLICGAVEGMSTTSRCNFDRSADATQRGWGRLTLFWRSAKGESVSEFV